MKQLRTANGKSIQVYDDLFSFEERETFYQFVINSLFTPNGHDTYRLEQKGHFNIFSKYSYEDVENMGLLNHPKIKEIFDAKPSGEFKHARVNLSTLNDRNHFHTDRGTTTLLYYPNPEWCIEWGGYTLFANETTTEIEHCVAYIPGRVVVFDGDIPHCIAAPTNLAPVYRFSFAAQYEGIR